MSAHDKMQFALSKAQLIILQWLHKSLNIRKRTFEHMHPAKIQISLRIRAGWSESSLGAVWIAMDAKFLHADKEDSADCADVQVDFEFLLGAHVRRLVFSCYGEWFIKNTVLNVINKKKRMSLDWQ